MIQRIMGPSLRNFPSPTDLESERQFVWMSFLATGIALLDAGRQMYYGSPLAWVDLGVAFYLVGIFLIHRWTGRTVLLYILAAIGTEAAVVLCAVLDPVRSLYLFLFPLTSFYFLGMRRGLLFVLFTVIPALFLLIIFGEGANHFPGGFFDYLATFTLILFIVLLYERSRHHVQLFLHDSNLILEKNAEEARKMQQEQAGLLLQQGKYAELGEMIGAIAHQWRQPLNTMGILIQDLEDAYQAGEMNPQYMRDTVEKAMEQILFMSSTIDDFRSFLRPSTEPGIFHGARAIKEVHSLLHAQMQFHSIATDIHCMAEGEEVSCTKIDLSGPCGCSVAPALYLRGYQNEFKQAILNIMNNSKDAILEKRQLPESLTLVERINIQIRRKANQIEILIEDSGTGIDDAIRGQIFDPHFTTKGSGTGVGLFLVRQVIVEKMHGSIRAERSSTGGARMAILLPGVPDEEIRQCLSN